MFKKLLLLLLLPYFVLAQTDVNKHGKHYSGKGAPTSNNAAIFKNLAFLDTYVNIETGEAYVYMGAVKLWQLQPNLFGTGRDGRDGIDGRNGVDGKDGVCPTCPPTSGGAMTGYKVHNPHLIEVAGTIYVQGTNSQTATVASMAAAYPGSTFPIVSTDNYDWANLQYAIHLEQLSGKEIMIYGKFQIPTSKMWDLGKTNYRLVIRGTFAEIASYGSLVFNGSVVGRPLPIDNADANQMIQAVYDIQNLTIIAQKQQVGFRPMPSYSSYFKSIRVKNASVGIKLEFNLNAVLELCDVSGSDSAFVITYGKDWGGTTANSQSNHTEVRHGHANGGSSGVLGKVGFGCYASSGVRFNDCIAEWFGFEKSFDINFLNSTVVKTGSIVNNHAEGILGNRGCPSGDAYYFIRMIGTYVINNSFMQYAGCMINAGGSPGYLNLIIEQTPWKVATPDGKLFVNAGNCWWHFSWSEAFQNPNNFTQYWYVGAFPGGTGVATTLSGGFASGINKWSMEGRGFTSGIVNYVPSAAKIAIDPDALENKPYKLTLTVKAKSYKLLKTLATNADADVLHASLAEMAQRTLGVHEWYFDTEAEAVSFAKDNPDFNYTIVRQ